MEKKHIVLMLAILSCRISYARVWLWNDTLGPVSTQPTPSSDETFDSSTGTINIPQETKLTLRKVSTYEDQKDEVDNLFILQTWNQDEDEVLSPGAKIFVKCDGDNKLKVSDIVGGSQALKKASDGRCQIITTIVEGITPTATTSDSYSSSYAPSGDSY